jgi:hypothetical protein
MAWGGDCHYSPNIRGNHDANEQLSAALTRLGDPPARRLAVVAGGPLADSRIGYARRADDGLFVTDVILSVIDPLNLPMQPPKVAKLKFFRPQSLVLLLVCTVSSLRVGLLAAS